MKHLTPLLARSWALLLLAAGLLLSQRAEAQVLLSSTPLIAGQHYVAGNILVYADADNVYIRYTLNDGWTLKETHLAVEADLASIPQTGSGNVKVGRFDYGEAFSGFTQVALYSVPRSELGTLNLYIATHAVVEGIGVGRQTAWSGPYEFAGKNWATYIYVNGDGSGDGPPPNR